MLSLKNRTQIVCMTQEEALRLLDYIEQKYPEIHWQSGHKPTEWTRFNTPMSIVKGTHNQIGVGSVAQSPYADVYIMASELLKTTDINISKLDLMNFLCEG